MARRFFAFAILFAVGLFSSQASAQKGLEIFDFMLQQGQREVQRQQQRDFERAQRQQINRMQQEFLANWRACHLSDIVACDRALNYPYLDGNDRQTLISQRELIIDGERAVAERARQDRIEAEQQARHEQQQQQLQAERERSEQVARQREQELRSERERAAAQAAELARQRAETERVRREREQEERRLTELRTFALERDGCRNFDVAACDAALLSPAATPQNRTDLRTWRTMSHQFEIDLAACRKQELRACDAALASPALSSGLRPQVESLRAAATPFSQALAFAATMMTPMHEAVAAVRNLPASTHVTGGIAGVLALTLLLLALRNRRAGVAAKPQDALPMVPPSSKPAVSFINRLGDFGNRQVRQLRRRWLLFLRWYRPSKPVAPASPSPATSQIAIIDRDTPAAIAALELAHAYIEEVRAADILALDDHGARKQHLNTLALASKQIALAQRHDADAILEGEDAKEIPYRYTINELKAEALLLEGLTHQVYDTKRAIPALVAATQADPNSAHAFYVLGLAHATNRHKAEAVAALQRAVALDPKTLDYRKELNRAENLTATEIAGYRATRAGEKIFDAGIKTANAGIMAWNIFAVVWNVATFPLRVFFAIFRFLRLPGFS